MKRGLHQRAIAKTATVDVSLHGRENLIVFCHVKQITCPKPGAATAKRGQIGRAAFCLVAAAALSAESFNVDRPGETVLTLELEAPGKDWSKPGRESVLADVLIDGRVNQQIMVYAGATPRSSKSLIFLPLRKCVSRFVQQ
jgi:hypothetical protein